MVSVLGILQSPQNWGMSTADDVRLHIWSQTEREEVFMLHSCLVGEYDGFGQDGRHCAKGLDHWWDG